MSGSNYHPNESLLV